MCDAAGSIASASQAVLRGEINVAIAKKSLDSLRSQGQAQAQMLEVAVRLSVAAGKGQGIDLSG
jgi:hypothetical protein